MTVSADRWSTIYCLAWTLVLGVGYFGGQFSALYAPNPEVWVNEALRPLTVFYWLMLLVTVAYGFLGRRALPSHAQESR